MRRRKQVERERTGVRLGTRHGGTVNPHLIVALGQTTHHDKLVVDERDTRHTANDLGGITVLGTLNLLAADTRLDTERILGGLKHTHIGVPAALGSDGYLLQHLCIGGKKNAERVLPRIDLHLLAFVADITDFELVALCHRKAKDTIPIGGGAGGGAADENCSTKKRLTRLGIKDKTYKLGGA